MKDQEVTNKVQQCVEELAGCIFVQSVETTALARMTPVPARGLNERNEQTKRRFADKGKSPEFSFKSFIYAIANHTEQTT